MLGFCHHVQVVQIRQADSGLEVPFKNWIESLRQFSTAFFVNTKSINPAPTNAQ